MGEVATITRTQYHQLCGLLVLGQRHDRAMDDIQDAIAEIIGDADWASDAVRGGVDGYNADDLLRRLKIEVADGGS